MTTATLFILVLSLAATGLGVVLGVVFGGRVLTARAVARVVGREVAAMRWQAAALAAEIARRHRAGEAFDPDFFRTWRLSAPQIFPTVGAKLGLLSPDAIDRVGYFHAQLGAARERLALAQAEGGFRPSPYRMLSALLRPCNHVQPWAAPHLDVATRAIPDLTDANALLGELEDAAREPFALAYVWADSCGRPDGDGRPDDVQGL